MEQISAPVASWPKWTLMRPDNADPPQIRHPSFNLHSQASCLRPGPGSGGAYIRLPLGTWHSPPAGMLTASRPPPTPPPLLAPLPAPPPPPPPYPPLLPTSASVPPPFLSSPSFVVSLRSTR